jgi:hypothetical protein
MLLGKHVQVRHKYELFFTATQSVIKYCNSVKTVHEQEMLMQVVVMNEICTIFIQFDGL